MAASSRAKQLAKRADGLLAAIRAEIEEAQESSALPAVGVLSFLEEAASLLKQAGLRMGWWITEGGPDAARPAQGEPEGVLAGDEVYAAFRYVAVQAPSLAPALAWAAASSPELVAVLGARPPAPGELAALAALDETLAAVVRASPAGFRRSGQVWSRPRGLNVAETAPLPGPPVVAATDVARSVTKVAQLRPALVPAQLWLIQHQAATRLAVGAFLPKPEELAELSEIAREGMEQEPGAARPGTAPSRVTEAEAKGAFASLAVRLDRNRAEVQALIHGLDREWPLAILEDRAPPDLAFWLFGAAETLAEYLDDAIDRAWKAADDTEESVRSEWLARHQIERAERTAELLSGYAVTAEPEGSADPESAQVAEDVETRVLPEVVTDLLRLKKKVIDARSRLPRQYPELEKGEPSRPAVLHGDLGILLGALDEALSQARTTATGVVQE